MKVAATPEKEPTPKRVGRPRKTLVKRTPPRPQDRASDDHPLPGVENNPVAPNDLPPEILNAGNEMPLNYDGNEHPARAPTPPPNRQQVPVVPNPPALQDGGLRTLEPLLRALQAIPPRPRFRQPLDFDWGKFQELLYSRFDNPVIVSRLNAQLFSRKQGDRESAGIFLQQKILLYKRIRDNEEESTRVTTLLELLKPSLRMVIRPSKSQTLTCLLSKAIEAEYDLGDQQAPPPRPRKEEQTKPPPTTKTPDTTGPPKCWYCPERHFNRDCPVNIQRLKEKTDRAGNAKRTVETPATAAPNPK